MDTRIFELDEIIEIKRKYEDCEVYNLNVNVNPTYIAEGFVVHNCSSELTNAVNLGAHDAIIKNNPDKKPSEMYVYKIVKWDAALCPSCKKFYTNSDGTPKIYRLSELQRNGDNYGRKAAELKPTIGIVHPRCRCQLLYMEPGWDFDIKTKELRYVGEKNENWRKDL